MTHTPELINKLKVTSFNLHGFNQGCSAVNELIESVNPDIFMLQEHWLTPSNLNKFDTFTDYFTFGCSAMAKSVESGMLKGRPFGGVITMIKNKLRKISETIFCSDRCAIVRVANLLLVNIYLPCVGTDDRLLISQDLMAQVFAVCDQFTSCEYIIAGDYNVNIDSSDSVANYINDIITERSLLRADILFNKSNIATYVNTALNHQSTIDYVVTSSIDSIVDFMVLDPDINFSDHLPIMAVCKYRPIANVGGNTVTDTRSSNCTSDNSLPVHYRWDHADLIAYYQYTDYWLQPLVTRLDAVVSQFNNHEVIDYGPVIDSLYSDMVNVLTTAASQFVPQKAKSFYKFWWDEELDILKQNSIDSNRIWKAAGKPRHGPVFDKRQSCRLEYRRRIKSGQKSMETSYTNELHDCLINKNGPDFWKCWRSKLGKSANECNQVDGCVDNEVIADKFAKSLSQAYSCNNAMRAAELKAQYEHLRANYHGLPLTDENMFDVELIDTVFAKLKRGRAAGLDTLTAEHLIHCHPLLLIFLCKLFNLMLCCGHVPPDFSYSYTIPIPKIQDCRTKAVTTDDFRGIAISPIISKVFEYCVLDRFDHYFDTAENQFGFKKGRSCSDAIYTVRKIVDKLVFAGSTVNLCAIDLSKAFDKVNHNALYIKLMERHVPVELLNTLFNLFSNCWTCIKWKNVISSFFSIAFGVRQGSVLSPRMFALYIDDVVRHLNYRQHFYIVLYADDILILAPTVTELQRLLSECECQLNWLDMSINVKKSCCIRIGPKYDIKCADITTSSGCALPWVSEIRYLGIFIVSSHLFKCSLKHAKSSCYRALNAIFCKVGRIASAEVTLELVAKKCWPILLYGLEACPLTTADRKSLDFMATRFLMKLFDTGNINIVNECMFYFGFHLPSDILLSRTFRFTRRFDAKEFIL